MIYVSLPVHTQPLAVASQLRNFSFFLPHARIVLHVAARARFHPEELHKAIRDSGCMNVTINPERVMTSWGNILLAHIANIRFIRRQGDATRICLHASNDMLVRHGAAHHIETHTNMLNVREVLPGTNWRFGQPALEDACLDLICKRLGASRIVGSQIEGSCYDADVLFEIADIISSAPHDPPRTPYPREEVWLSTVACALGARIDGRPYIFSEFHRFDRVFWKVLRVLNPLIGTRSATSDLIRRCVEYVMIKSGFHRISPALVDTIARGEYSSLRRFEWMSDGNNCWQVFEPHGLFGVKRVPRRALSPLRLYIDAMAADCLADDQVSK